MGKKPAFTLIELLVVTANISLLLAILLPSLRRVRDQTRGAVCRSNLRQWGLAFSMYTQDNSGRFPPFVGAFEFPAHLQWFYTLRSCCGDVNDLLLCPAATRHEVRADNPWPVPSHMQIMEAGSTRTAWRISDFRPQAKGGGWQQSPVFYGSYGMNGWVPAPADLLLRYAPSRRGLGLTRANTPVLLDCVWVGGMVSPGNNPPKDEDALGPMHGDLSWFCIDRHGSGINGLFLDWSVRKVGLKELWMLDWLPHFPESSRWTKARGVKPTDWPQWMRCLKDY
jgi:prepilin-type processing-associated H-X9-DG protein